MRLIETDYGTPPSTATGTSPWRSTASPSPPPRARRSCAPRPRRASRSPSSAPPTACAPSARVACAWWRSRDGPGSRPPAPSLSATACGAHPVRRHRQAASRSDGAVHLRPSARLPDLLGQRRLRAAGRGRRGGPARGALPGAAPPTSTPPTDASNPYFDFDPVQVHPVLALRARLQRGPGHLRADRAGTRLRLQVIATGAADFMSSDCVSCGACVQACPTATLMEKSVVEHGVPDRTVLTTCAYCGVGCSFKAELKGDQVVRMVPYKDGKANHGHACVKGRFAWGYANHKDRITDAHGPRDDRPSPGARSRGRRPSASPRRGSRPSRPKHGRVRHRRHHLVALHQRGGLAGAEAGPRRLRQQQRRHLRPCLPLAHGLRAQADLRHVRRHPALRLGRPLPT